MPRLPPANHRPQSYRPLLRRLADDERLPRDLERAATEAGLANRVDVGRLVSIPIDLNR